jgi:hypothetical protein
MSNEIPHVWHTLDDEDGHDCRHLAMCEEGATQAHLLHFGMLSYDPKTMAANDEGAIGQDTDITLICFDPLCVLYGLSFNE